MALKLPTRRAARPDRPYPPHRTHSATEGGHPRRRASMAGSTPRRTLFSRRGFLTVGTFGFGLTLSDFFRLRASADQKNFGPIPAKADSVIHIFLPGGIAHQESFDPKPYA